MHRTCDGLMLDWGLILFIRNLHLRILLLMMKVEKMVMMSLLVQVAINERPPVYVTYYVTISEDD